MRLRLLEGIDELDFTKQLDATSGEGLVTAIAIDERLMVRDGVAAIRMVAAANRQAVEKTLLTGLATFYSRTRQELWTKGETSGNTLKVEAIYVDCDADAILYVVQASGPTCHTGADSCFGIAEEEIQG